MMIMMMLMGPLIYRYRGQPIACEESRQALIIDQSGACLEMPSLCT